MTCARQSCWQEKASYDASAPKPKFRELRKLRNLRLGGDLPTRVDLMPSRSYLRPTLKMVDCTRSRKCGLFF
jgi:hypothetical protein